MKWLLAYILALVALQLMFGNINVEFFSFPIGLVLGVAGIALLYVAHREFGGGRFITYFRSARMAYVLLALVACCCVAGGAVPAFARFTTSVPFVGLLVALLAHLALVMMHRLRKFSLGRDGAFACVHLGIWLALFSGMTGAADTARLHALLAVGEDVSTAYDENGCELPLRHTMRLQRFAIERNPANNTVVQFRAWLLVDDEPCELAVNSPHSVGLGEDIYLMSYHLNSSGTDVKDCVIQVVHEPWKYVTLLGIVMLLLGVVWNVKTIKVEGKV